MKLKNKKAQAFTLIAVALISLMVLSFNIYSNVQDRTSISSRIISMDSFLSSVEKDLERQMYIVGFRTIVLAQEELNKGNYIDSSFIDSKYSLGCGGGNQKECIEIFLEKQFFDTKDITESELMYGARKTDLFDNEENSDSLAYKAGKLNLDIETSNFEISVYQEDPFNITLKFEFDLAMEDESGLASWNKREIITTKVNIENFYEPLYIISTNTLGKRIKKAPDDYDFQNIQKLQDYASQGYYTQNDYAPSFLMRIQGQTTADSQGNGIERLIDVSDLANEGVDTSSFAGRSIVDYIYFKSDSDGCQLQGAQSWFILDDSQRQKYGDIPCVE
jgi:hypothetical protein